MARPSKIIIQEKANAELSEKYRAYLQSLGYVAHSCQSRYNYLREYLGWREMQGLRQTSNINAEEIKSYRAYLQNRASRQGSGSLSGKTVHAHLHNLRVFFGMLQQENQLSENPFGELHYQSPEPKSERQILTQNEIHELYKACGNLQEQALLSLAYGCGLRAGELEALDKEDIHLRERLLAVKKGKGNKRRLVPLSGGVAQRLHAYCLQERKPTAKSGKAFLLNSRGGRMRSYTANKLLKQIIGRTENETIKSKDITLHSLRHSIATHLLERGLPAGQVREFLGHSQLETTQIYTRISQQQIKSLQDEP